MDGENNGKPYFLMDDLGVPLFFWKHPYGTNIPTYRRRKNMGNMMEMYHMFLTKEMASDSDPSKNDCSKPLVC